ncbi:MAG: rod shape-determining protein MreC [Draconibacterium sp.]|nr:rod shape-determining protein MreC [Draconibacterium sp.]
MRSLFRYLLNNHAFLLFLLLEVLSLVFVFNYNKYQRVKYLNSSNRIIASVYNSFNSVVQYFELTRMNRSLAEENAKLKSRFQMTNSGEIITDSVSIGTFQTNPNYRYISARVINNSVNKKYNYITLNKGRKQGVKPDMGIVSHNGIVGVVTSVSESYALGFSVLNSRWGPSAKLKKSGFYGPIEWNGDDYQFVKLMEIPFHVKMAVGDTIVTSGYSSVFPEGIMIGVIQSFSQPEGESFYDINVKLATDFKSIYFVEVIDNMDKEQLKQLEDLIKNGASNN